MLTHTSPRFNAVAINAIISSFNGALTQAEHVDSVWQTVTRTQDTPEQAARLASRYGAILEDADVTSVAGIRDYLTLLLPALVGVTVAESIEGFSQLTTAATDVVRRKLDMVTTLQEVRPAGSKIYPADPELYTKLVYRLLEQPGLCTTLTSIAERLPALITNTSSYITAGAAHLARITPDTTDAAMREIYDAMCYHEADAIYAELRPALASLSYGCTNDRPVRRCNCTAEALLQYDQQPTEFNTYPHWYQDLDRRGINRLLRALSPSVLQSMEVLSTNVNALGAINAELIPVSMDEPVLDFLTNISEALTVIANLINVYGVLTRRLCLIKHDTMQGTRAIPA